MEAVAPVRGGFSKATYIVTLGGTAPGRIVLRQDQPGLPSGTSVVGEYDILRALDGVGVAVPRPLWIEPDEALFDGAVMAVGYSPGATGRSLPADPAALEKLVRSHAREMGKLHGRTLRPELDVPTLMRAEIDDLRRRADQTARTPHPGVELGFAWLRARAADLAGRPACRTHGDFAFHNALFVDDVLDVVLDWEGSHFSDPMEDLVYIKPFIERLRLWPQFLETYREHGGLDEHLPASDYFRVFNAAKIAVMDLGLLECAMRPGVDDLALMLAGKVFLPKYEVDVLSAILTAEAARGPAVTAAPGDISPRQTVG